MRSIFKLTLILLCIGLVLAVGSYALLSNLSGGSEKIIEEKFHKNGKIALRKVDGYDCCEGFYAKTIIYDSSGRKVEIFGNQDGSRIKEIFKYQDSILIFEGYYAIYNDSLENKNNFDINKMTLSYLSETEYYADRVIKSKKTLSNFDETSKQDTASLTILKYDNSGKNTVNTEFRRERDLTKKDTSGTYIEAIQYTIIEDKIRNSVDTLEVKKIKLE